MPQNMKKPLNFTDIVVLACIFFGYFTHTALAGYFAETASSASQIVDVTGFSDADNFQTIIIEAVLFGLALLYLRWRRFDFGLLDFSANARTVPLTILLILLGSITTDAVLYGTHWFNTGDNPFAFAAADVSADGAFSPFAHITWGLLLFALCNGFFEEFYFMGLAFATEKRYRAAALLFSVAVRFGFHVYQGLPAASAIALSGVVFLLLRFKIRSLLPFVLAHAFFDVFGAGLLTWWQ